jgi:hypothetical protein
MFEHPCRAVIAQTLVTTADRVHWPHCSALYPGGPFRDRLYQEPGRSRGPLPKHRQRRTVLSSLRSQGPYDYSGA